MKMIRNHRRIAVCVKLKEFPAASFFFLKRIWWHIQIWCFSSIRSLWFSSFADWYNLKKRTVKTRQKKITITAKNRRRILWFWAKEICHIFFYLRWVFYFIINVVHSYLQLFDSVCVFLCVYTKLKCICEWWR